MGPRAGTAGSRCGVGSRGPVAATKACRQSGSPALIALLSAIFFGSGVAALLFETLWFRQAGLAFGTSVWAASLVLAGFMGGLALGNAAIARVGHRITRPLRAYALLEVAIGVLGLGLVVLLPRLGPGLAPLLRPFLDQPA